MVSMTSGSLWRRKTRSRASRKRLRRRALGCSAAELPPASVYGRLRLHHFVDFVAAVSNLAQDRDAVSAEQRGRTVIVAVAGGKPVWKLHVDDLAFDRMVDRAEKFRVGEVLVGDQAFQRVHAAGRDVGLGQNLKPFRRGPGAEAHRTHIEIGAQGRE